VAVEVDPVEALVDPVGLEAAVDPVALVDPVEVLAGVVNVARGRAGLAVRADPAANGHSVHSGRNERRPA
jgi:hypothetical protein